MRASDWINTKKTSGERAPLYEAWRGCLGLAMLLERPDDTQAHGELALVRNQ